MQAVLYMSASGVVDPGLTADLAAALGWPDPYVESGVAPSVDQVQVMAGLASAGWRIVTNRVGLPGDMFYELMVYERTV